MSVSDRSSALAFLDGGGRMGALMRAHDWRKSPLGDPAGWHDALKSAVSTCLSSRFPMVVWWGPDLIMLYNDAWQPILGETKHPQGMGRPGEESWPETWPIVSEQFTQALRGIGSWSEDLLLASDRHGYLEECYFTYSHSPLRDASGKVVGVHSVVSETTARVLSERRLRILGELARATLEATSRNVPVDSGCGTLIEFLCRENPDVPFALLYLVEGDEARLVASSGVDSAPFPPRVRSGQSDGWGIGAAFATRSQRLLSEPPKAHTALPGGIWPEPATQTFVLPIADSSPEGLCAVLVAGVNSRLRADAPWIAFAELVGRQIAAAVQALRASEERHRTECERIELLAKERAARAEAERSTRIKDEFLAMLSHELRTPLHAIMGWTQIMRMNREKPTQVQTAVEVIERNARMQAQLISDLLDVSRIVSGTTRLEIGPVALHEVIAAAVDSLRPVAEHKDIRVQTQLEHMATVRGDSMRLQQIVWNLLSNAIKFTPPSGSVEITLSHADSLAEIAVRDSGEGIAPELLPHIFERFRQADASISRPHGGLGLGLTIVKQYVELHGGCVRVMSDGKGKGATFVVWLPLEQIDSRVLTGTDLDVRHTRRCFAQAKVLIVDDEPDALAILGKVFEDHDARVHTADSTNAAIEVLADESFDLIVSDIGMPGRDGYDLIEELRARNVRTPALALTAFAHTADRDRALSAGYQAHIVKPVNVDALLAAAEALIMSPEGVRTSSRS